MLAADVGRGVLVLTIPLTAILHGPAVAAVFVVAAPLSLLSSVFDAGGGAVIPSLVGRDDLGKAYGLFEGAESLAWVAGPMVAGLLAAAAGVASALVVDGLSFFVSALGLALIRIERPASAAGVAAAPIWAQIGEGLRYLAATPALRRIQVLWSLYGLIGYGASPPWSSSAPAAGRSARVWPASRSRPMRPDRWAARCWPAGWKAGRSPAWSSPASRSSPPAPSSPPPARRRRCSAAQSASAPARASSW
jgi:hypothetical protein